MFAPPRSTTQKFALSFITAITVAAIGRCIAFLAEHLGASDSAAHWLDDTLTGLIAGVVVFVGLRSLDIRRAAAMKRLQHIADMNHRIRNALDVIRSSHFAPREEQRVQLIDESSQRIVTALLEFDVEQDESESPVQSKVQKRST